jgi:hypothetical protein
MSEESLNGTDVSAALEEVGGERVTECMAGDSFWDVGFACGVFDEALQGVFMEVVTGMATGPRMRAEFCGREDELPGPFAWGVGVFAGEGFGHVGFADAGDEVLSVVVAEGGDVVVVRIGEGGHGFGKERGMEDAGAGGDGWQVLK